MAKVIPMVGDIVWAVITDPEGVELWRKRLDHRNNRGKVDVPVPPEQYTKDGNTYTLQLHQPTGEIHVLKLWQLKTKEEE